MLVVYAIVKAAEYGWGSAHTLGFAAAGAVLLAGFAVLESRLREPLFPLRILRVRGLMASSVVRGFLITGMFSTFVLGSLYLQRVRGYGALETGLAFLPMTLVMGALSLGPAARLMRRFGAPRMLFAGLGDDLIALVGLSRLGRALLLRARRAGPVHAARARRRPGVPAADDARDGRRARHRRGPGVGHRQRLAADLGGDRRRRAGNRRHRPGGRRSSTAAAAWGTR